ncbi:MAG: hypothetical protein E7341_02140 [Clostridiales bacterium]|nr:hypothetical protein [Clostridiales bacterium]
MEKNLKGNVTDFITKESYEKLMYKKCRNCGEEISSKLYFERRTCPRCGECCSKAEMKDIHIFFELSPPSDIGVDFLRYYRDELKKPYERKIDYNIYQFAQEFDIPKNSLHFWSKSYCDERASSMICDIFKDKGKSTKLYLWCNALNANSILNLLYYAERFENCDNVYYVKFATKQDLKNKKYKITDSINNAVKLKKSDFKNLKKEYLELTKKDGYFLSKDDKVVYYNEDFFNKTLLDLISNRYKSGSTLLYEFRKSIKDYGVIYYTQFRSILDNLCKKNLVDSKKYYDTYMNLPEHEFKLAKQQKAKSNYLDALELVSLALEDSSTYSLYRILKDDAVFHSLDTDNKIEGKENIINYLENINLRKLESEYNTPCRAYKLNNESVKYYEDVKMYIHYPATGAYNEVKIQYNDGMIDKIIILNEIKNFNNYEQYNPFKLELKKKPKNKINPVEQLSINEEKQTKINSNFFEEEKKYFEEVLLKSTNYVLTNHLLKLICPNITVFNKFYHNEEEFRKTLFLILENIKKTGCEVNEEFYFMPVEMINNGIYLKVPNVRYECECNYVCIKIIDNELYYCTSEYYEDSNIFRFCYAEINGDFRAFAGNQIMSFEDFQNNVEKLKG